MLKSITLFLVVSLLGCSRAACPPTGDLVMPHEGDVTKYVFCREGMALVLGCDDGTAYNPLTKRCESSRYWSERAPTCSINQAETLYFPHETSCSMFYTCAYGVTNQETCPEGLEYNQDLKSCDWPSPNGCFANTTTPPPTESTTESTTEIITDPTTESTSEIITDPTTESTTEIITETTPEITSESPTDTTPTDPPVKCPLNGTDVTLIPHPTKCDTFYVCWDGVPTMQECFVDYEFDAAAGGCVLISDSGCTASKTSTTGIATESTTDITTESTTVTSTDPTPVDPPVKCPTNGTITMLPHPTECNMFYVCWDQIPTLQECYDGYEFDPQVGGCVLLSDSGCTASKTSTTVIATESTTDITTESTTVTSTDPTPVDPPIKCPTNGTITILMPHPTECDMFYFCWEEIPTVMKCYEGYEFDPQVGGCVLISDSGCTASKTTIRNTELVTPTGPTAAFIPECDPDTLEITLIPHPTNCQVYYVCWGGIATSISCIYDYEFDVASGKCVLISSTGCTASKTTTLEWSTSTESSSSLTDDRSPAKEEPKSLVVNKSARYTLFSNIVSKMAFVNRK